MEVRIRLATLAETAPGRLVRALEAANPAAVRWARQADEYISIDAMLVAEARSAAAEANLERARLAYVGRRFWYNERSLHYGSAGTVEAVDKLDPPDNPEALTGVVRWSETHSSLGRVLYLDSITWGEPPVDMPWVEVRPGREWRARLDGVVYVIGAWGEAGSPVASRRFDVWTERLEHVERRLSEMDCEFEHASLDAAKAFAEAHRGKA